MNEEILKKLGYNNIALEMLLKREAQINPDNIIMPGDKRTIYNGDDQATEITLDNIKEQYITLINTIESLPDEHDGDNYFGKLKNRLLHVSFDVGLKIKSLMTQIGMDDDDFERFINRM